MAWQRCRASIDARLNYTDRRLAAEWRAADFAPAAIVARLTELGYKAHPFEASREEARDEAEMRFLLRCLAIAGFAAMNIMLFSVSVWSGNVDDITGETRDFFHWISALIALPAAAYAGQPFFRNALRAIRNRSMTMDVPISLGVCLALGMSLYETIHSAEHAYFDSAVMLLFFLLLGRVLDQVMRRKTRAIAGNLLALRGETAIVLGAGGEQRELPVKGVKPGDHVLVRPGDRIAVDGEVLEGRSEVDASLVTGETAREIMTPGARVYAGTVNVSGALTVVVTAAGEGTLLQEVNRLVETAASARSRYLRLADRAARIYSPVVHLTAFATAIGWLLAGAGLHQAIITAIAVLIITCPCALALAVPATQVVASGNLFRAGVLLQSGEAIERMAQCDTIVFDKTGTLTMPDPRVVNSAEIDPALLGMAARLALSSRHPLAAALAMEARGMRAFSGASEQAGHGVSAIVDGEEARLGSAAFCDAEAQAASALAQFPDATVICFSHRAERAVILLHQLVRPDAVAVVGRTEAAGLPPGHPFRRPRAARRASCFAARHRDIRRRVEASGKDRRARRDGGPGPESVDGWGRPQRRARARRRSCFHLAHDRRPSGAGIRRCALPRRSARPRHGRSADFASRGRDHAPEPLDRGAVQSRRRSACHCRLRHAADRGGSDVGLVHHRHTQCPAGPRRAPIGKRASAGRSTRRSSATQACDGGIMNVLVYLLPIALGLGLLGLGAFLWSLKSGQYDDLDGAAARILDDDDLPKR